MVKELEASRSAGWHRIIRPLTHLTSPHRTAPTPNSRVGVSRSTASRVAPALLPVDRLLNRDPERRLSPPHSHPSAGDQLAMAPVKLYGATLSWNVTRCVAALEEAGVDYEIVPINFGTGEHKGPDHLARNPFGQVPALQDGDLCIFESRAICKYACRKNKPELLKEGDLKESAMVDVWLEVEANQYTATLGPILFECLVHPMLGGATDQKVVEANLVKLKNVLEVYEARLTKCKYLPGDYLSLADLNHASTTLCLGATPYASLFDAYPHVKAWWTDLVARPSVQKVAALMKPSS